MIVVINYYDNSDDDSSDNDCSDNDNSDNDDDFVCLGMIC